MSIYTMSVPANVVAGRNSAAKLEEFVKSNNWKNAVVLTDSGVEKSGTLSAPLNLLREIGTNPKVISDLPVEPTTYEVVDVFEKVKSTGGDFIVAIGGGSVMDIAKMIAVIINNPEYAKDVTDISAIKKPGIPVVMLPTSAGTGAEATPNSIVLVPEKKQKQGVVHPYFMPQWVILDPELTVTLPKSVTASTGLDTYCHAIETYISKKATPFSKVFSLESTRLVAKWLRVAYAEPNNIQARENMLLAAYYGGLAIASASTVAVHALSYPLGGSYHVAHGTSNAILLPHVMEYNMDAVLDDIVPLAQAMGIVVQDRDNKDIGDEVSKEIHKLVRDMNIPENLSDYNITDEDLDFLTDSALDVKRLLDQNPKEMSREDILEIYRKII